MVIKSCKYQIHRSLYGHLVTKLRGGNRFVHCITYCVLAASRQRSGVSSDTELYFNVSNDAKCWETLLRLTVDTIPVFYTMLLVKLFMGVRIIEADFSFILQLFICFQVVLCFLCSRTTVRVCGCSGKEAKRQLLATTNDWLYHWQLPRGVTLKPAI